MGAIRYTLTTDVLIPVAIGIPVGASATGYGPEFCIDFSNSNLGRPCLATGAVITLQFDFGAAVSIAGLAIWHNADDGLTFTIAANSVASFGSPPYTSNLTVLPRRGDGRTIKLWKSIAQIYRYVQVTFPTNSIPPGLKIQFYKNIRQLVGTANDGDQFQWNSHRPNVQYGIDLSTSLGFHWVYNLNAGAESRTGTLMLTNIVDMKSILFWHQNTGGRGLVLFVPDSNSAEAYLARIALGPSPGALSSGAFVSTLDTQVMENHHLVTLSVEDMTAGGPEWT